MSASWFSGDLTPSKRFQLGELLSERARHFLLMTATPHNGKKEDFRPWSASSSDLLLGSIIPLDRVVYDAQTDADVLAATNETSAQAT